MRTQSEVWLDIGYFTSDPDEETSTKVEERFEIRRYHPIQKTVSEELTLNTEFEQHMAALSR